jgi:hypothetical protein
MTEHPVNKPVKRGKVFAIGINAHNYIDNIITLIRSSNDLYDGALDYIFYKVLNLDPIGYYNMSGDEEFDEHEIDEFQRSFEKYDEKFETETNAVLSKDIKEFIVFLREEALKAEMIEPVYGKYYLDVKYSFSYDFIIKKIFEFYRRRK